MKRTVPSEAEDRSAARQLSQADEGRNKHGINGQLEPRSRNLELETDVALYRTALERAREEMQSFAYSVSHDLRAPLRAIEGFSKILLDDFSSELGEEPRRYLQHVISNAQQLGTQIEDLLRFYRAGKSNPSKTVVDANAICREALSEALGGKKTKPEVHIAALPSVHADPVQLRQIFLELLGNAIKFSGQTDHPKIEISFREDPSSVTFVIRDNGAGFEVRNVDRLFKVFQKLHSASEFTGNGIGLAIVKKLVDGHGGCVNAEGNPGKGAVFSFTLPSAHAAPKQI